MKERPILFSAPMVRALLAGSKTQTRRVVKPRKDCDFGCELAPHELAGEANGGDFRNSYCAPGDRLLVRETWYCDDYRVQRGPYLKPDDMDIDEARKDGTLIYRASSGDRPYEAEQPVWRPAIHMPRWASRITLEVTGVRVERLQDISEDDTVAEGIPAGEVSPPDAGRFAYRLLWEQINGPGSWEANPWVWVIAFKRLEAAA